MVTLVFAVCLNAAAFAKGPDGPKPGRGAARAIKNTGIVIEKGSRTVDDAVHDALDITIAVAGDVAGKPAKDLVRTLTDPARFTGDILITIVADGGHILQGKNPLIVLTAPLAAAIRTAKAQYEPEAKPIPESVRARVKPYYPAKVLDKARYTVGDLRITLPEIINTGNRVFLQGDHAVCVDNVIVFSTDPGDDIAWWAHELEHVAQYDDLGIDTFAYKYAKDLGEKLEADARKKRDRVVWRLKPRP